MSEGDKRHPHNQIKSVRVGAVESAGKLPETVGRTGDEVAISARNGQIARICKERLSGSDGTRTRDLRRDRPAL
jgi:hypothetical protein